MRKIPTLFEREFEKHEIVKIHNRVMPGMEWVLEGKGNATIKMDGACCAIFDGKFYRRYDCKNGKTPPAGFIPCCDPDPVTGHWPGWILCDRDNPGDKWFWKAYDNTPGVKMDGTYEAIGEHFRGNPYGIQDVLEKHGIRVVSVERSFEGIREFLMTHEIEGLVFWLDGEPMCKIKRSDFGFPWNEKVRKRR